MSLLDISSQITFLYFQDFERAKQFFQNVLELEPIYDPGWAVVYKTAGTSYIGAVNAKSGSIRTEARGGVLISFTVRNIEQVHAALKKRGLEISDIKKVKDIELESFFFKGPEGYDFEIQQFCNGLLLALF